MPASFHSSKQGHKWWAVVIQKKNDLGREIRKEFIEEDCHIEELDKKSLGVMGGCVWEEMVKLSPYKWTLGLGVYQLTVFLDSDLFLILLSLN